VVCAESQIPLERQMQMLFFDGKPGCLALLLWSYIDESSDGSQKKAFVAAGFIAPVKTWIALRNPWKRKLKEHRIAYFKSSECRNLQGEFHKYKREFGLEEGKRKALLARDDLERIIRDSSVVGFALGTNMADFWEVNSMPEAKASSHWNSDYEDATFQILIHDLLTRLKTEFHDRNYQIGFVHDDSSKSAKLKASYDCFKMRHPDLAECMRSFTSLDDKKHPPLQMADLMADVARDMVSRKIDNPDFDITPRHGVNGSVFVVDCWQKAGMQKIARGKASLQIAPCLTTT
jgi:hypothetical protein